MAPTIGRVALDNGFHGSIPGDWVAPPPQNIHLLACLWIALYTVISIQKEKGFQSTLRDKSCTLKPWH